MIGRGCADGALELSVVIKPLGDIGYLGVVFLNSGTRLGKYQDRCSIDLLESLSTRFFGEQQRRMLVRTAGIEPARDHSQRILSIFSIERSY